MLLYADEDFAFPAVEELRVTKVSPARGWTCFAAAGVC